MNAENHTTGAGEQKLNAETPVPTAEPFIDKREVARRMGRTVRAVDKMMRKGILPYYKFDWQVAFRWSEVEAQLVRTCRVAAGSANGENISTPHPGSLRSKVNLTPQPSPGLRPPSPVPTGEGQSERVT